MSITGRILTDTFNARMTGIQEHTHMSQHYSDPTRESDPHALPDVEVWRDKLVSVSCERCGCFDIAASVAYASGDRPYCPSCEHQVSEWTDTPVQHAWFFQFCLPGCLPDSDPYGPYETKQEAIDAARDYAE